MLILFTLLLFFVSVYLFIPYWRHRNAIKRFHSYYLITEEKPELEVVYVDRTGNKWYSFKEFMKAPAKRATDAEALSRWSELCMTPEHFAVEMNKAISFQNKQQYAQATNIMSELLVRSRWAAERTTLELLANCLFLIEGENPLIPTDEFMQKKKEIWKRDPECEGFFLTAAFSFIRKLDRLSEEDLMNYLRTHEVKDRLTSQSHSHSTFFQSLQGSK